MTHISNASFTLDEGADTVRKITNDLMNFQFLRSDCENREVRVHMYCGEGQ